MPTNDFIGFASAGSANIMSQADYAAAAEQTDGVQPGMASSKLANKAWRQGANMAAALGEIIKAQGIDALDNGDIATLSNNIVSALSALYLPLAGGQMSGNITKNALDSILYLSGGRGWKLAENGARLVLYGRDEPTNPGAFFLGAGSAQGEKSLVGRPDGTLTWGSLPLVCGEFYSDHCKLNNKIEMECGYVTAAVGDNTVTFKRPFTVGGATPRVFVQPWVANAIDIANVYGLSATGFYFATSKAMGVLYFAISLAG